MSQKRNKTGIQFEKEVCDKYGWSLNPTSPKLSWSGKGRSNLDKIKSVNMDPNKFKPNLFKSKFDKYDAIGLNGEKIEIKKYRKKDCNSWKMLSEPIFKIANRSQIPKVMSTFGVDDMIIVNQKYNSFLEGVRSHIGETIKKNITSSFDGIQLIDEYVNNDEIEFKWKLVKGWLGFNRLTLMFRVKQK